MSDIKIVEYQRQFARELARMWNMSSDSWGGFDNVETEETVAAENANSENLKTWLALDGDEIVGYCSFSEYREDEGASYIPLLNVRPDYHSKKVGKALVLRAVQQACQYSWPRLDLYTWPGNTKAVPLYKKCGFFWENRDDTTHLMNFIPYVLRTEAVEDFFQEADWYSDSVREIEVQPDGRKENAYEYFGYHWQHNGRMLKMEFERRGRGLRLIETEDWLISATVQDLNLAFGRDYTITFQLVNKTGKPLEVAIKGLSDKNIDFALDRTVSVEGEALIQGDFRVGPISEEQNVWRTHPGITAELLINGKKALFKVGIVPKFPAMVNALVPEHECYAGCQGEFYLNIENSFKEPARFKFTLPEADFIQLPKREYDIALEAGQRLALPVPYLLKELGIWGAKVKITALPKSGGSIEFDRQLTAAFAGYGGCFSGETEQAWFVVNGRYTLALQKFNNLLEANPLDKEPYYSNLFRPQLGLPFSVEFSKTKPVRVEHGQNKGVAFIRACYQSKVYPGIEIVRNAGLQADGLAWQSWEISNQGSQAVENLWFRDMIRLSMNDGVLPVAGKVIETRDGYGEAAANFPLQDLSENWVFSRAGITRGLCWAKELKPASVHGMLNFDQELGRLEPGQKAEIKPKYLSLGAYRTWQDFRSFALKTSQAAPVPTDSLEVRVNDGNPFVDQDYDLTVQEYQNVPFEGTVEAESAQGAFAPRIASIGANKATLILPAPAKAAVDLIRVAADIDGLVLRRKAAVFGIGGEIHLVSQQREGMDILTVDNGAVQFSVSPDYAPAMFSLINNGKEWLDSSFPTPRPKSWWNPWLGGSAVEIYGISGRSLLNEPRSAQFASLQDNAGNKWQGIQIQVDVANQEKYKGLKYNHTILTLPGLSGICMFVELEHNGLAINDVECLNEMFMSPSGAGKGGWAEMQTRQGEIIRYKQGAGLQSPRVNKMLIGTDGCPEQMVVFAALDMTLYTNKEIFTCGSWDKLNLIPGQRVVTRPAFYFFTKADLPASALEALAKIRF